MNILDFKTTLDATLVDILDIDSVSEDLSVENCDTWDSVNHLRIVVSLEEQFPIRFTIDEIETVTSRRRLLDVISIKMHGRTKN